MNFNILNPTNIYSPQEVQRNVRPAQTESTTEDSYVEPIAPLDTVTLSEGALSGQQSNEQEINTYENLLTAQRVANHSVSSALEEELDLESTETLDDLEEILNTEYEKETDE